MMLNYSFHENIDGGEGLLPFNAVSSNKKSPKPCLKSRRIRIISEKIKKPQPGKTFARQRLNELLANQLEKFGSSLIFGRAGTGKTTLALDFAKDYERVVWFRVESTDSDWETFAQYFISSFQTVLPDSKLDISGILPNQPNEGSILNFLEQIFSVLEQTSPQKRLLIALDDLHSVFDADWFETFFKGLLSFEIPSIQMLLLSRSKPSFPLWRLRSKQKLGVLDESLLLFTLEELEKFSSSKKSSKEELKRIHKSSFGRISKILELQSAQIVR